MEPVSGETIVLPPEQASEDRALAAITASRQNYAVEWKKIVAKENKSQLKQSPNKEADDQADGEKPGFSSSDQSFGRLKIFNILNHYTQAAPIRMSNFLIGFRGYCVVDGGASRD